MNIHETLRNIHLPSNLTQFSMDILWDIPENIPVLARAFGTLVKGVSDKKIR